MAKKTKLTVENLSVSFRTTQGLVRAVRDVSFELYEGETLAIVGESGSGKSVTSRTIMGILAGNGIIDSGRIMYEGQDLTKIHEEDFHKIRGDKIGMIFQDPMSSLNPIMRIGKQITEGMLINGHRMKNRYRKLVHDLRMDVLNTKMSISDEKIRYKELMRKFKDGNKTEIAKLEKDLEKSLEFIRSEGATVEEIDKVKESHNLEIDKLKKEGQKLLKAAETEIPKLKKEHAEKMDKLTSHLKVAKKKFKKEKPGAKKQIQKEWADKKLETKEATAKAKEKLNNADKSNQSEYKKVRKEVRQEIDRLQEDLRRFKKVTKREAVERAVTVMDEVGIPEPKKRLKQYPFQFSGGMRQRIVIAIALTANPDLLICDEPTTALDVTIQSQILELIKKLKEERNLSVIFITHDLGVVANMADRVGVMYAGKIVEIGTSIDIFYKPQHPYTWALLSSMPDLESTERLFAIPGTPPNMLYPPKGDAFADRNPYAMKIDFEKQPPFFKITEDHYAATWLLHKDAPKVDLPDIVKGRIERMTKREKAAKEVSN